MAVQLGMSTYTLDSAAVKHLNFGLNLILETAAQRRLGVRLSPNEVDAVLKVVDCLRTLRKGKAVSHYRGLVNAALAPFEEDS